LTDVGPVLTAVFREEAGRLTGALVRIVGDFALAEEVVHDAILVALERWPVEGIPDRPGAWLFTVARRKAIDRMRREARHRDKLVLLDQPLSHEEDDRLRLIFTCCHPALNREAQIALTLRVVCGLTPEQIARAFVTSEAAIAKRLVRARRKIVDAAIPYRIPNDDELEERLAQVLSVLYCMFNEGYLTSTGPPATRQDLAQDAVWLESLLVKLLPGEAEPLGLLALMQLHLARARARFDCSGEIVLLKDQDRSRWDRRMIGEALDVLVTASNLHHPGPYQLQAAIVACHCEAGSWEGTDWAQIVALYDALLTFTPTPIVAMNRAIALRELAGPDVGLAALDGLGAELDRYHLFHAARADMLLELGRRQASHEELAAALQLVTNPAERSLLERRLAQD
jgi:RNA polymerase sigma-70 factor (ECF subfamily)